MHLLACIYHKCYFRNRCAQQMFNTHSRSPTYDLRSSCCYLNLGAIYAKGYTFHVFYFTLTDFQNFPEPVAFFHDFPVLENATKFQDFPDFPGPVRSLIRELIWGFTYRCFGCHATLPWLHLSDDPNNRRLRRLLLIIVNRSKR